MFVALPSVRLPPMVKAVLVVVMSLDKVAAPVVLNPPAASILPAALNVNVPLLVTATAPVASRLLFTAKSVPFNVAEPTLTVSAKVVVPVAALVWVRAPVIPTLSNVAAAELVMVKAVRPAALAAPAAPNTSPRASAPVPA